MLPSTTTKFHGWDILLGIDQYTINTLLAEQHHKHILEGKHIPPLNKEISIGTDGGKVYLENLTLGVPKLSFEEANFNSANTTLTFPFNSGTIVELNGQGQVINFVTITPHDNNRLVVNYPLQAHNVTGQVDQDKVSIVFSAGDNWKINTDKTKLIPNMNLYLEATFKEWLKQSGVEYPLTQLRSDPSQNALQPTKFLLRTQAAPHASFANSPNYGEGALLAYIATQPNNNGGDAPGSEHEPPYFLSRECYWIERSVIIEGIHSKQRNKKNDKL